MHRQIKDKTLQYILFMMKQVYLRTFQAKKKNLAKEQIIDMSM